MSFEPFDEKYKYDKSILTKDFPDYLAPSVNAWCYEVLDERKLLTRYVNKTLIKSDFIFEISRQFRLKFDTNYITFITQVTADSVTFRNYLTFLLQNYASVPKAEKLESILEQSSSAYAVEIGDEEDFESEAVHGIKFKTRKKKLVYRVPPVVKAQAYEVLEANELMQEAWDEHYKIKPDDEKTVTRVTDALAGLLRDRYFPELKRTQFGTLLGNLQKDPPSYPLPANSLYDTKKFLSIMSDFSKIRGNHKTGTGRAPTHEEAGFVLHFGIMLFQLLKK